MSRGQVVRHLSATQWLLAAVVATQLVVPAIALLGAPPTRFGFQMYSAQGGAVVEVVDRAGRDVHVDLGEVLAGTPRPELDWTRVLPERICESEPQAVRVTVIQPEHERTVRC